MTERKSPPLNFPTPSAGRIWVHSKRDGDVEISASQLLEALKIDPHLVVYAIGAALNLQNRLDECRDASEVAQLMKQARLGEM